MSPTALPSGCVGASRAVQRAALVSTPARVSRMARAEPVLFEFSDARGSVPHSPDEGGAVNSALNGSFDSGDNIAFDATGKLDSISSIARNFSSAFNGFFHVFFFCSRLAHVAVG